MKFAKAADRIRRYDLRLPGALIITKQFAVGPTAVDDDGIGRVRHDIAALPSSNRVPVAECDRAIIAAARGVDGAAVLLCSIDMVRKLIVYGHVIHLRRGLVVPAAPGLAAVHADAGALVATGDHALRVCRINPQGVIVISAWSALDGNKRFSAVRRTVECYVGHINCVRVLGINVDFAEVPCAADDARIDANARPCLPAIVRAKQAAILYVDQGINTLTVGATSNGQTDASPIPGGQAASGDLVPGRATICGFVNGP